jgi:predicted amino acid-binding ACT domain protein
VTVFERLRVEFADQEGALAAVSGALARCGLSIVEVSIHELDGPTVVDEIVVSAHREVSPDALRSSLDEVGATLLSIAPCAATVDSVVATLTWVTSVMDGAPRRQALRSGVMILAGVDPVAILTAEEAMSFPGTAAALGRTQPVVVRTDHLPPALEVESGQSRWLLAAPLVLDDEVVVVFAARPVSLRFTATEVSRFAAVLDCFAGLSGRLLDAAAH